MNESEKSHSFGNRSLSKLLATTSGAPLGLLQVKKNWAPSFKPRYQPRSKIPRPLFYGILAGALTSLLLLTNISKTEPQDVQAGPLSYSATWVHSDGKLSSEVSLKEIELVRLQVKFDRTAAFGIFAGKGEAGSAVVKEGLLANAGVQELALNAKELAEAEKVCVVAGETRESYLEAARLVPEVWKLLNPATCVRVVR